MLTIIGNMLGRYLRLIDRRIEQYLYGCYFSTRNKTKSKFLS